MNQVQKIIKYLAIGLAIFLIINIFSTIFFAGNIIINIFDPKGSSVKLFENLKLIDESRQIDNVKSLEVELKYTNLEIKKSDEFKVETNNPNIIFETKDDKVIVKEKKYNWNSKNKSELIIYIPKNVENLEKVEIENGAGILKINDLKTNILELELGAGNVEINNINVLNNVDVEGGAGNMKVFSANLNNLDLDLGVGETIINATLTGKNNINAGVGNIDIDLTDGLENYTLNINKGIGNIKIEGKKQANDIIYGKGSCFIDIEGGIGNIDIK